MQWGTQNGIQLQREVALSGVTRNCIAGAVVVLPAWNGENKRGGNLQGFWRGMRWDWQVRRLPGTLWLTKDQ